MKKISSFLSKGSSFKCTEQAVNVHKVIHDPNAWKTWLALFGDTFCFSHIWNCRINKRHLWTPKLTQSVWCVFVLKNKIKQTLPLCTFLQTSKQNCRVWVRKDAQLLLAGHGNSDDQNPHQLVNSLGCHCNFNWKIPLACWVVSFDF